MAASNAAQSDKEELLCILYKLFCVSISDRTREPYCIYVVTRFEILLLIDLRNNGHVGVPLFTTNTGQRL